MTRIALVRHGETTWNRDRRLQGRRGTALTATGRTQAASAATLLRELGDWRWAATSPAARARETAVILARGLVLPSPAVVPALEEGGYGVAEGLPISEAEARWPGGAYPGREPADAIATRAATALAELSAAHPAEDGVVISHGLLIRLLVSAVTTAPARRIRNGSVTVLRTAGPGWTVEALDLLPAGPAMT